MFLSLDISVLQLLFLKVANCGVYKLTKSVEAVTKEIILAELLFVIL